MLCFTNGEPRVGARESSPAAGGLRRRAAGAGIELDLGAVGFRLGRDNRGRLRDEAPRAETHRPRGWARRSLREAKPSRRMPKAIRSGSSGLPPSGRREGESAADRATTAASRGRPRGDWFSGSCRLSRRYHRTRGGPALTVPAASGWAPMTPAGLFQPRRCRGTTPTVSRAAHVTSASRVFWRWIVGAGLAAGETVEHEASGRRTCLSCCDSGRGARDSLATKAFGLWTVVHTGYF